MYKKDLIVGYVEPEPKTKLEADEAGMVLLRAAEVIEEYGWCQQTHGGKYHGFCVMGAIHMAMFGNRTDLESFHDAYASPAYEKLNRFVTNTPVYWNDKVATSKQDVLKTLREAAYAK